MRTSLATKIVKIDKDNADVYFPSWLKLYRDETVNPFMFKPQNYPDSAMRQLYDSYFQSPHMAFFIYESSEREFIGTARMTFFKHPRSHVVLLNAVAIHPNFQGQGYGSRFLNELIGLLETNPATRNITQVELSYEGDNPSARNFYQKLQFTQMLNYEDWWTRSEFQKKYFWYADERCCVRYLSRPSEKFKATHLLLDEIVMPPALSAKFSLFCSPWDPMLKMPDTLKLHYCGLETKLFETIISKPNQCVYYLTTETDEKEEVQALLLFRTYGEEPRLKHATTMPCVAFVDHLSAENLGGFIHAAIKKYREKNPEVFHFSTSEEDTQENWYTERHPKIGVLTKALQLAGFKFLGAFQNYFDDTSKSGTHLLGFSAIFLGFEAAMECLERSKLTLRTKMQLTAILSEIQIPSSVNETEKPPAFSDRAQYEIYRIIRIFAYPQDYSHTEKRLLIEQSCALLKLDPSIFIPVLEEQTSQTQNDLFPRPKAASVVSESEANFTSSLERN